MVSIGLVVEAIWHIAILGLGYMNITNEKGTLDKIEGWTFIMALILFRMTSK